MIFCVEDEANIRELVVYTLETTGFEARGFEEGTSFFEALAEKLPELILLDIMLPGEDGMEILKKLKTSGRTKDIPVIMVTAKGAEYDKVMGLDAGADDYLVKPFSFQELEARIKALLRRNKEVPSNLLTCDNLVLDCNTRKAKRGDIDIDLTVKEYRLLEYFMTHQGVALSRITLLKDVWDKNFDTNTNIVDVYVNYLRVKIDRDFDKKLIHTVVGLGYIMNT